MKLDKKYKKIFVEISRVIIGITFIFSGFVKAVDPWGSAYKFTDYFEAFGLGFLSPVALIASFFLSALEFGLGLTVLLGLYRKYSAYLTLLFMSFMTLLTLYLAIANPVHDCGCFGDALILTNWQTFFKNVFLMIAVTAIFLWYPYITPLFSRKTRLGTTIVVALFILGVSFYCYMTLPILDFRPYKIGNNIPKLMEIPEGSPTDEYELTFIYSKDGVEQEFSMDDYPKTDDWTFVDRIDKLVKKGYEPPITDFELTTEEDDDITEDVLNDPGYTFFLVSYKLEKASNYNIDRINDIYDYCQENGYAFYCLTSSLPEDVTEWKMHTGANYPFCFVDGITLKTMIRSNPGLMLIKDGNIINKWANLDIPGEELTEWPLEDTKIGQVKPNQETRNTLICALLLFVALSILYGIDLYLRKSKTEKKKKK